MKNLQRKKENCWIWIEGWNSDTEQEAALLYFRRDMELDTVPENFWIDISADTRYKLYINEKLCGIGPLKGDQQIWFYDEIDVAPFLKKGHNIWAVEVLRYPLNNRKSNMSLFRTATPGIYVKSKKRDETGVPLWKTDKNWKVKRVEGFRIESENPYFAPLQIYENNEGCEAVHGWMKENYDDRSWDEAAEYGMNEISVRTSPGNLQKRSIPPMRISPVGFRNISRIEASSSEKEKWNHFLTGNGTITVPPYSRECIDIDAGELMTGFLRLFMEGGKGAVVDLLQAECYVEEIPQMNSYDDLPIKGDRTDSSKGLLSGNHDFYVLHGMGDREVPEIYEPFWFRTFRFIRFTIETGKEPLLLRKLECLETGYPLEIKSHVETSDVSMKKIWDISVRSLKRCMHESYTDCPFYEQLQYAMDSRSQILFTYAVAADDRLARKCMEDFKRSQRYNGLLSASYPCTEVNVIPCFSIYYIGMLYDHMMYFGDRDFIEEHLPVVEGILQYFHRNKEEHGLIRKIGDVNLPDRYWSFIDWTPQWKETNGVPKATLQGPITMESLLYILGLQYAVSLCRYLERTEIAQMYEERAAEMRNAVNCFCRGKNGMYQDGPAYGEYSQHCQVFAVLTDTVSVSEGRKYLLETLEHKEKYAPCSVAMMYYVFRALEKCGLYDWTEELWDTWRDMLKKHMTTCAEDSMNSRSDCHGWGALALYELPSVILGVRPATPGYEKILIKPVPGRIQWAEGEVVTPKGRVKVKWKMVKEKLKLDVEAPKEAEVLTELF